MNKRVFPSPHQPLSSPTAFPSVLLCGTFPEMNCLLVDSVENVRKVVSPRNKLPPLSYKLMKYVFCATVDRIFLLELGIIQAKGLAFKF